MKIKLLVQILLSSFILSTLAAVPSEINYQGLITDSDGDPIESATNSVAVNLYQVETGGTAVYTQSFTEVASDANGIYSIQIGGASLQSVLETNSELWLELIINEETLTPRQEINSVPYALVAKSAESFAPGSAASNAIAALQTENTNRVSADASLQADLNTEATSRTEADATLQAYIDQNESDADAAIADLEAENALRSEKEPVEYIYDTNQNMSSPIYELGSNQRILLVGQTDLSQNGIYTWQQDNSQGPEVAYSLVRAQDFDEASEMRAGAFVFVTSGNSSGKGYVLTQSVYISNITGYSSVNFKRFTYDQELDAFDTTTLSSKAPVQDVLETDLSLQNSYQNYGDLYFNTYHSSYSQGDRILLIGQNEADENGIYEVRHTTYSSVYLSRAEDLNEQNEFFGGIFVFVESGPLAGQGYVLGALHDDFQLDYFSNYYGYHNINFSKFTIDTTSDISLSGNLTVTGNRVDFSSAQEVIVPTPDQDNEATSKAYVDDAVAANTSALAAETSARATAITALQTGVDQNESDADAAILAEASTARAAEQVNADDIFSNTTDISNNAVNISNNSTDITTNSTNISANTGNVTNNSTGIAANNTNIATNADAITAEVTRAEAAEVALQADIDQNESDADAAIAALQAVDASSARQFVVDFGFTENKPDLNNISLGMEELYNNIIGSYYSCEVGDTVLLSGQSDSSENGIYEITNASGQIWSKTISLARSSNYDSAEEFNEGDLVLIERGGATGLAFMLGAIPEAFVLGNDALTWYRCGINTNQDIEFTGTVTVAEIRNNPAFGSAEFRLGEFTNYIRVDNYARFDFEGYGGGVRFRDDIEVEFDNYRGVDFDTDVEFTSTVTVPTPTEDNEVANKAYVDSVVVPTGGLVAWPVASGIPNGWSDSGLSSPMTDYIWIRKD